jgi:hypothetical protein
MTAPEMGRIGLVALDADPRHGVVTVMGVQPGREQGGLAATCRSGDERDRRIRGLVEDVEQA